jgi:predicted MFS family arabinose efflux permease
VPKVLAFTRLYRDLPKAIWTLFLTETVMATGSFVYPFLAFVLTSHFGMTEQRVGCVMAVSAVASLLGTVAGGMLADGMSRRNALVGAMTLSALAYAAVPLVTSSFFVSLLIVLGLGFMAATKPAFDALVSDLTVRDNRRAAFSLLYAAVNIGFAAGPILASILFAHHVMWLFLGDAAATLLSAALIVSLVRRDRKRAKPNSESSLSLSRIDQQIRELWPTLREHPTIVPTVLIYMLNIALYAQVFFAVPLYLSAKFGGFGPKGYGLVMTVNAIAVVLLTPVLTSLTRRLSPGICLAMGGLLFAVGLGGHGVTRTMIGVMGLVLVWTLGEMLTTTNARVFVADLAPKAQRGRLGALLQVAHELGFGIGPIVAGYIIAHRGVAALWPCVAAVGAFTCVVMAVVEWQRAVSVTLATAKPRSVSYEHSSL